MTLRLRNVQVDVPGDAYDAAVAFWAAALGGTPREVDGPYVHLDGVRSPVGVHLQRLGDGEARYHLDLEADDPAGEVDRLLRLGATRAGAGPGGEVLRDPAGSPFCVCPTGQEQRLGDPGGPDARLHFVALDLPHDQHEPTRAFWSAAFGVVPKGPGPEFPAFTLLDEVPVPAGRAGVLVQDVGEDDARIHLDLHVPGPGDRDREVERLEGLGAERVGTHGHWVVLAAPGGHLFCVVPDRKDDQ